MTGSAFRIPRFAFVCAVVVAAAQTVAAQTVLPPLPRLALDAFPPQTRDVLSRAYTAAVSRPTDVSAVGLLGRLLQAWDQVSAVKD